MSVRVIEHLELVIIVYYGLASFVKCANCGG